MVVLGPHTFIRRLRRPVDRHVKVAEVVLVGHRVDAGHAASCVDQPVPAEAMIHRKAAGELTAQPSDARSL